MSPEPTALPIMDPEKYCLKHGQLLVIDPVFGRTGGCIDCEPREVSHHEALCTRYPVRGER